MRYLVIVLFLFTTVFSFSQEEDEARLEALKKSNDYVFDGNKLLNEDDYVSAEMEYRKAISQNPSSIAGAYNLGNAYYAKGSFDEAVFRLQQAAETATTKSEKHKAFHNIGTILMKGKKCKEAVEAFKNALRNNPADDETRYNLGLAKECAKQQEDQNKDDKNKDDKNENDKKDENKDNQENKDNKDKEGDNKDDKKDEGDQDKKEGDDKKDEDGKPKDEKEDKGKDGDKDKKEQQQPKPQPGQMSPQQIKNLLEAMNNQEQKVQEKMNAEKVKGVKVKTEKDW